MLKIWYYANIEYMKDAPSYFDNVYEDEWIEDSFVKEMIQDVDHCTVISSHVIDSPILGAITPRELSGSVKVLILMLKDDSFIYNMSNCGDNCAKWILKIAEKKDLIGSLVRMKDISLNITNEDEVLGIKTMISGAIGKVPVEGMGDIDITALLSVMLKDAAYILEGELPEEKFGKKQRLVIKIPMQTGNELENQYSLSDLEIGKVTLMGIYRGAFEKIDLMRKLNRFSGNTQVQDQKDYSTIIESDSGGAFSESTDKNDGLDYIYHYLDVIAVVQDISF